MDKVQNQFAIRTDVNSRSIHSKKYGNLINVIKMIFYYENFLDSIPSMELLTGAVVKYIEAQSISELK